MTNYDYFFGNAERVARLLMGDPQTTKEFNTALRQFKMLNPEDPYVSMITKEDGSIVVINRCLDRWVDFLNTEYV